MVLGVKEEGREQEEVEKSGMTSIGEMRMLYGVRNEEWRDKK